ncbi:hypothetical protein Sjap_020596 [Stephania japonica]|uniref:Uncharacterized protein n=1 Tax=Stephania japonica TaxID=461633 RepID=A0AAP0F3R6_9MAGN
MAHRVQGVNQVFDDIVKEKKMLNLKEEHAGADKPILDRGTFPLMDEAEVFGTVMEYNGLKLQEAVDWVVKNRLDGQAGMIAVSSEGEGEWHFILSSTIDA